MARARFEIREWNADKLLARSTQILEDFAPGIAEEARRQIITQKWVWPNPTLRFRSLYQGGRTVQTKYGTGVQIPEGKRDIVDTGFLLSSQTAPLVKNGSLSIEWTAPYSGAVLRGSYPDPYFSPITRKQVAAPGDKPPRNWIQAAYREQPLLPFFVQRWNELSGARRA
jgi:hypothetical protein